MLSAAMEASQRRGFDALVRLLGNAQTVAVCAHTSPDGDAIGSELALMEVIRRGWPNVEVCGLLADDAPVPRIYRFLPGVDELVPVESYAVAPDLFVSVDLSDPARLNRARSVWERSARRAILDHHPQDRPLADAYVIRPEAAAAGIIVRDFARHCGVEVTASMAQNLMCALITDTGRFQYQNSDAEAFECASFLVSHGADPAEIALNVYQSFRLSFLHLKSLVMGRITTFENGRIAYSYATHNDIERTGADLDESDGLIDVVRSVSGSEIALFLKTVPGNKVRGNLRSKGSYDVSSVAKLMGGGGHRAASGFTFEGDIDEALAQVLPPLRELLRSDDTFCGEDAW